MRFVTDYGKGILGKPDSVEMWSEIISNIPNEVFLKKDVKFVFPACGHCTEADLIAKKIIALGNPVQEVKDRFILIDKYSVFTKDALRKGYTNVITGDFLETDMGKLDGCIVLMNAPYLKRKWLKFVEKALTLNPEIVATINPDPTNNDSDFGTKWRDICIDNGIVYRKDVTEFFPNVSSGRISSFVLNTSSQPNKDLLKSDDPIYESILAKVTVKNPSSFVIRGKQEVSGYGNKEKAFSLSDTKTDTHVHPCIMSCNNNGLTIKYSDRLAESKKHSDKLQDQFVIMNRFFGKNNPDPVYVINNMKKYNLGYDCLAFKLEANETLDNFMSVYSSKLYRYVMNTMRNGGFDITQSNFMRFARLDLTKRWTDEDIYKELNLTAEEIAHFA
tara:strand:- start:523 stop:1686 length:1164 start_codon:yes stop_codon:yes gene_type:complete